ncbi:MULTISPECIES: hypothetical protein [unclassified Janthinobacterium]|uniref:hypothetical protein n=1 Tax=unclassified Janthinobacterium TaxID=2610881 RepID=UPI000381D87F|nr:MULTISPECIES: hypothetical protein [unclassified Janthinobacterium]MEC5162462.1 hypothetical protein [Janthinobacterium sp. CG_S6]
MKQIIEIRGYKLKLGSADAFHQVMQQRSVPLLLAAGTDVVAARSSLHSPDDYLLIRAYRDVLHRRRSQERFYGSQAWLQGPCDAVMACIDSYTAVIEADQALIDSLRSLSISV